MKVFSVLLIMVFSFTTNIFSQVKFTTFDITTSADGAQSVYAIDIDGDGDIDVLSASFNDDKIAWYENDGNENFSPHTISISSDFAYSVFAIDMDGDGDIDVLSARRGDYKTTWYENDGIENFAEHTIDSLSQQPQSVYAIDMDGDGDIDVLSATEDKIAWYKNDGFQNFQLYTISTNVDFATSVYAIDMDGDGDIDVLSASADDDKIAWYRKDGVTGVESISNEIPTEFSLSQNYPNPFNPSTKIKFEIPGQARNDNMPVTLKIYDVLGNEVATLVNEEKPAGTYEVDFNAGKITSGVYFYKLTAGSFVQIKKMLLLK